MCAAAMFPLLFRVIFRVWKSKLGPDYCFVLDLLPFFLLFQTKLQNATKLKKILQDSKETVVESDVRGKMQPLKEQLTNTISHVHTVFETHVFIAICRGYWDRLGQVS